MSEPFGQLVRVALLALWGSWVASLVALEWVLNQSLISVMRDLP
jgi:hypothetical protein